MRVTAIYVHYHCAALLERSFAVLRADAAAAAVELDAIIVDNGSDSADSALLRTLPAFLIEPGQNLGFAAAVNRGVRLARGQLLLLVNPDARVLPGALAALVGALRRGAGVAGPRFRWSEERRILLPPAQERSRWAELILVLGERHEFWARRARRRWRRQARRHWQAGAAIASWDLSGGFLAIDRDAWTAVGEFDEGYRLYFEETDWLQRARAAGVAAVYEPLAEVVHDVAASSALEPRAEGWFESSAARFRRRRYGVAFATWLERFAAGGAGARSARRTRSLPVFPAAGTSVAVGEWIEIAATSLGVPAAGEPGTAHVWLPPPPLLRQDRRARRWFVRRSDSAGRETGAWIL